MDIGKHPALIVIDMQNGFCNPKGFMGKIGLAYEPSAEVIGPISRLLNASRKARIPIYFTRYSLNEDYSDGGLLMEVFPQIKGTGGLVRDSWDAAVVEELEPADGEIVLDKTRYSAFYKTDLEERLHAEGVDSLIVCGVTTNICVESTVRDAFFRDIRPIVPEDGTAAVTPELHEGALEDFRYGFCEVVSISDIESALENRTNT
tara:strand:- start:773 stop:1384 length:612 start_codon:yes stop_codon:yes gene_type:complete